MYNLNSAMTRPAPRKGWEAERLKVIRFRLIKLPGRVLTNTGRLIVRRAGGHPSNETLFAMRRRVLAFYAPG